MPPLGGVCLPPLGDLGCCHGYGGVSVCGGGGGEGVVLWGEGEAGEC